MSMYELLFADGEKGFPLLGGLGFKKVSDVGRYRSAWLEKDEKGIPRIAVFTRNGGGNREEYQELIDDLKQHPNYLCDRDDDFDSTYCTIYFSVPDSLKKQFDKIEPKWVKKIGSKVDMSKIWLDRIEKIGGKNGR